MPYILIQPKHILEKVDREKKDLTSFGMNLLGDTLRDILDPRLRGGKQP
jgi:hypothetical protein